MNRVSILSPTDLIDDEDLGDRERIIIIMPSAFGHPSSTSVRGPKSNLGTPLTQAASSERSSTIPTFLPDRELFLPPILLG